jgi:predicted aspartyl protease
MKDVSRLNFERSEAELKKIAADKAAQVEPAYTPAEIITVEADLKDFELVDDGTYLYVSHKAAQNATIGKISKTEYEGGDKEALLRSVLENKFAEYADSYTLKITGSFVEPTITVAPAEEVIVIPVEKKASQEKSFEPAKEIESDLPLMRSADAFQQSIDAAAAREQETFNRFITATLNDLVSYCKTLRYDEPRVVEAVDSSNLTLNDTGINGHLVVSASLLDSTGPRALNIPIPVTNGKAVFPTANEMQELVAKSIDVNAEIMKEFSKEILSNIDRVDATNVYYEAEVESIINEKEAVLEKTASDYTDGVNFTGPGAVIKLQKHLLPVENLDVGDVLYADGKHYRLVDKGEHVDQNDKNAESASLWSFVECLPDAKDKPKGFVQR